MPHVIITEGAAKGLERCRRFLVVKAPEAARRAGQAIERQFLLLETAPGLGRPLSEMPDLRELLISFGGAGYVALYRHEPTDDAIYVLAFRHQKEAGYLAETPALPDVADTEFEPPRVTIGLKAADFSSQS